MSLWLCVNRLFQRRIPPGMLLISSHDNARRTPPHADPDRRQPRHRPCDGETVLQQPAWRVIACSRHAFPENCPWAAGPEDHIQVDLSDPADTERAVSEMRERLPDGKLDALVNNAAISPKGAGAEGRGVGGKAGARLGIIESEMALWRQVFEVNFFATIWLATGLVEELQRAQGAVVNVTSTAGSRVHPFAGSAYSTSKAALAALTREMAADFGPLGVRVNAIAPGEIDTAILVPRHRQTRRSHPAAQAGHAGGSRQGDLLSVYGPIGICDGSRAAYQRGAACVRGWTAAAPNDHGRKLSVANRLAYRILTNRMRACRHAAWHSNRRRPTFDRPEATSPQSGKSRFWFEFQQLRSCRFKAWAAQLGIEPNELFIEVWRHYERTKAGQLSQRILNPQQEAVIDDFKKTIGTKKFGRYWLIRRGAF